MDVSRKLLWNSLEVLVVLRLLYFSIDELVWIAIIVFVQYTVSLLELRREKVLSFLDLLTVLQEHV